MSSTRRNSCSRRPSPAGSPRRRPRSQEALPLFGDVANENGRTYALLVVSANAAGVGDDEFAAILVGANSTAAAANNFRFEPFEQGLHDRTTPQLRERLGAECAEALFARGRELPFDEAVELAAGWRVPG